MKKRFIKKEKKMKIIKAEDNQSIIRRIDEFCKKHGLDEDKIELEILGPHYFYVSYTIDENRKLRFQGNCDNESPLYGFSLIGSNNQEYNLFVKNGIEPTKENINAILDKETFDMLMLLRNNGLDLSKIFCQKDKLRKLVKLHTEILKITNDDQSEQENK